MLLLKIIGVWLTMVVCAIANGLLRDTVLHKSFGSQIALPMSGVLLAILIFLVTYVSIDYFKELSGFEYLSIGLSWVGLTLSFEYGFGHYVQGKSWSEINQVFDLAGGNLFLLVLVVTALAPYFTAWLKGSL